MHDQANYNRPGSIDKLHSSRRKESLAGYLFLAPLFVLMGVFVIFSIYFLVRVSLYKWDGVDFAYAKYIGTSNYYLLFTDPEFYRAIKNVLIFMAFTVTIQMFLGMIIAVLLRGKFKGRSLYSAVFYIPVTLSYSIIAMTFSDRLYQPNSGLFNTVLKMVGLRGVNWLGDPTIALFAIIIANIFQWMGASMVFYIAGLTSISEEYFEAAQIDGAGFWRTLRSIVMPLLRPTHATVIILGIIGSVNTFDLVWLLTQGGPGTSTNFLATYLYRNTISQFKAGYGSAIGVVMILLALGLSVLQNKIYERSKVEG